MNDDIPKLAPSPDQIREAKRLLEMMGENQNQEELRQWLGDLQDPERQAEKEGREARRLALEDFVNGLRLLPASYDLPEGFEAEWEDVLRDCEAHEIEKLTSRGRTSKEIKTLMRRGWISPNLRPFPVNHHLKMPPPDLHPIPVVLVNEGGRWRVPDGILSFSVEFHPFTRAASSQFEDMSTQDRVLRTLEWAKVLPASNVPYEQSPGAAATWLEFAASDEIGAPDEMGWISGAKETTRFWEILMAAIRLGISIGFHEVYSDGSVDALTRRSLLLSQGKAASDWRLFIENELEAIKADTGNLLTPKQLRERLGAKPSKDSDDFLVFKDPRCASLPPITWPKFQICAKKARQKLDL